MAIASFASSIVLSIIGSARINRHQLRHQHFHQQHCRGHRAIAVNQTLPQMAQTLNMQVVWAAHGNVTMTPELV
eukprot:3151178-Alexandrium_andersonii.AAC.1